MCILDAGIKGGDVCHVTSFSSSPGVFSILRLTVQFPLSVSVIIIPCRVSIVHITLIYFPVLTVGSAVPPVVLLFGGGETSSSPPS